MVTIPSLTNFSSHSKCLWRNFSKRKRKRKHKHKRKHRHRRRFRLKYSSKLTSSNNPYSHSRLRHLQARSIPQCLAMKDTGLRENENAKRMMMMRMRQMIEIERERVNVERSVKERQAVLLRRLEAHGPKARLLRARTNL